MAASHLLLFLVNSVRIFGQGICYDSNTTKGFNYWKGDVNRERYDEWEERCEDLDEKIEEIEELLDD